MWPLAGEASLSTGPRESVMSLGARDSEDVLAMVELPHRGGKPAIGFSCLPHLKDRCSHAGKDPSDSGRRWAILGVPCLIELCDLGIIADTDPVAATAVFP